jgi:hypothetical protein
VITTFVAAPRPLRLYYYCQLFVALGEGDRAQGNLPEGWQPCPATLARSLYRSESQLSGIKNLYFLTFPALLITAAGSSIKWPMATPMSNRTISMKADRHLNPVAARISGAFCRFPTEPGVRSYP